MTAARRGGCSVLLVLLLVLLGCGCTSERGEKGSGVDASLGIELRERHREGGISFQHTDGSSGKYFIVETLASGVILFDFDLDGDLDIYFVNGRPLPPTPEGNASASNALYRNDGGCAFTDVTREKGVPGTGFGAGGAAGDVDGDGDLDLYVCQHGPNVLYRNEGKEAGFRFTDVTRASGADDPRFSAGASFFDMDRDGDLDLYVTNYCRQNFAEATPFFVGKVPRYRAPSDYEPEGDSFFLNHGDGTFRDVTRESGIAAVRPGRGMGVVATDLDSDGWLDLYVANDGTANFLLHNLKNGKFEEIGLPQGAAYSANGDEQGSMGVDAADFDRDGDIDLFCTNFQKQLNALYRNDGAAFFTDVAMAQGLGEASLPLVKWGTAFIDFDHDGWLDLFVVNGHLEDHISEYDESSTYRQERQLFRNTGNGVFKDVTRLVGKDLEKAYSSRGAAFGDLDQDGDIDIVVSNSREEPSLYVNEGGNRKSWVLLELAGKKNRFAVGAFVKVVAGGIAQVAEVHCGASYVSQNDLRLHFGLGDAALLDSVEVRWPEGLIESFHDLTARRVHRLVEGSGVRMGQR